MNNSFISIISKNYSKIIIPSVSLDLFQTSMLIYNYGKHFSLPQKQTIENFVENNDINNLQIGNLQKEILFDIHQNKPLGYVHTFIDNQDSCIQVAITICESQKRISVIFRGSESLTDWYYNLTFFKYKIKDNIRVHKGIYNQLFDNNTYQKLIIELNILFQKYPDFSIYLSGHSLGAGLSTLFGYLLSYETEKDINIFSFASPRIGNYYWKQSFEIKSNLKHYRITNDYDIIPSVPNFGYYHVGENIRLLENSFIIKKNNDYKWYQWEFWVEWYYESILRCWSITEHKCETYYQRLKKLISN